MKETDSCKSDSDSEPLSFPIEVSGSVSSSYIEGIVIDISNVLKKSVVSSVGDIERRFYEVK